MTCFVFHNDETWYEEGRVFIDKFKAKQQKNKRIAISNVFVLLPKSKYSLNCKGSIHIRDCFSQYLLIR